MKMYVKIFLKNEWFPAERIGNDYIIHTTKGKKFVPEMYVMEEKIEVRKRVNK